MGQFDASLESGHTTASVALKRLAGCAAKNRFYRANRDLGRVNKTEVDTPLRTILGATLGTRPSATPASLLPFRHRFHLRSLPSTGITRLSWYCGPLRHPAGPT